MAKTANKCIHFFCMHFAHFHTLTRQSSFHLACCTASTSPRVWPCGPAKSFATLNQLPSPGAEKEKFKNCTTPSGFLWVPWWCPGGQPMGQHYDKCITKVAPHSSFTNLTPSLSLRMPHGEHVMWSVSKIASRIDQGKTPLQLTTISFGKMALYMNTSTQRLTSERLHAMA